MRRITDPESLLLARFSPRERAGRAHEAFEWFRVMRGMQRDETHALPYTRQHALDDTIAHFPMRGVTPPNEHVCLVEHSFR